MAKTWLHASTVKAHACGLLQETLLICYSWEAMEEVWPPLP